MKLSTIIYLIIPIFCSSCIPDCPKFKWNSNSPGEFTYTFMPQQFTFRVGDTITFSSALKVSDFIEIIPADNDYDFMSQITCKEILPDTIHNLPSADSFNYKLIKGTPIEIIDPKVAENNIVQFKYQISADSAAVKVLLIPKAAGYYALSPFSGSMRVGYKSGNYCKQWPVTPMTSVNEDNYIAKFDSFIGFITQPDFRKRFHFIHVTD